ncbi:RNA-binding domain-containing protein [Thalassospira sp. MIT1370]|uniref:RNA-binding domain-containing protein n=1 Tax=unclassified Thalassospira TaxID=2648997 RepID=UPI00399B880A
MKFTPKIAEEKPTPSKYKSEEEKSLKGVLEELRTAVDEYDLSQNIINLIVPNSIPYDFETQLWDYKSEIPQFYNGDSDDQRKLFRYRQASIIKDIVAFHNSYGGYILFGVHDKGSNRVKGVSGEFDCGEVNKKIQSYTDRSIECLYRSFELAEGVKVGLLLIPRRKTNDTPVCFRKDGPSKGGDRAFRKETYVRIRDECRPAASTSEDWKFLHSDRNPPERKSSMPLRRVEAFLPPRDPELIKFVGRDDQLAELRSWLSDVRNPVKLITGIGGLGKTTLALQFAEEVISNNAGDIEKVIWLTAKQQTYSALRGKMVPTGRVDFQDLSDLLKKTLEVLSYDVALDDEEVTIDDLIDHVIEAISIYTCLIIVDDLDSLTPDLQKEFVSALNGVALRTVGREIPPTRILMTSRIDQGLPPTSVLKISGLERPSFNDYVNNLTDTFKIKRVSGKVLDDLFISTSGSPLFTTSIIRLVKLGENLSDATSTWKGQDGEEVRRFAFEREIDQLDDAQGKLLYAVLLLRETSINDLTNVLESTSKIIRDRISELQAYHLIATNTSSTGDTVIVAPSDLVAITEIIKRKLGANASLVESSCARAQQKSNTDVKEVGLGIRRVLHCWDEQKFDQGVIIAKQLCDKFSKSGDAASILGAALLKLSPPDIREANKALSKAHTLGCRRREFIRNFIQVKKISDDWQGLHNFTLSLSFKDTTSDAALDAFVLSSKELIKIAEQRNDLPRVEELSLVAVEKIATKLTRFIVDQSYFETLVKERNYFSRKYVYTLDKLNPRKGDKLSVFEGVFRLANSDVILLDLVRHGILALNTWWDDVESRPYTDTKASNLLAQQLRRLGRIQKQFEGYSSTNAQNSQEITYGIRDLSHRGASYERRLS